MKTDPPTRAQRLPRNSALRRAIGAIVTVAGLAILIGRGLSQF